MKALPTLYTFIVLAFIGLVSSCTNDQFQESDLQGHWEIQSASRNGKATESMRGLFLEFGEAGKLNTNMAGMEESYSYELNGDQIYQRDGQLDADYNIETLSGDSLVLSTTLRSKEFRMVLARKH